MGHNVALTVTPPLRAWPAANISNGVPRPTKRTNFWVPDAQPGQRKLLTLTRAAPVAISRVVVHFDTDYDHALESVLRGHPERTIPFCVMKWRVLDLSGVDDKETELFVEDNNHHSRREAVLAAPLTTSSIGIEILELNGDDHILGGIFEVRAY